MACVKGYKGQLYGGRGRSCESRQGGLRKVKLTVILRPRAHGHSTFAYSAWLHITRPRVCCNLAYCAGLGSATETGASLEPARMHLLPQLRCTVADRLRKPFVYHQQRFEVAPRPCTLRSHGKRYPSPG